MRGSVEELAMDVLDATTAVGAFITRAVVNDVPPLTFLVGRDGAVLDHARRLLSRECCSVRTEKVLAPQTSVPTTYAPIIIAPITTALTSSAPMISTPATSAPTTSALNIYITTTSVILPASRHRPLGEIFPIL